jgi:hypothetical protein
MGTPRLTGFLIGVLLVGFFVAILGIFLGNVAIIYNPEGYDNTSFEVYNQMATLNEQMRSVQSNVTAIRADQSWIEKGIDIFGGMFGNAWSAAKLTFSSIDLTTSMVSSAETELSKTPMASAVQPLKLLIGTLLLIVLIIGIGLALLLSREKL